MPDPGSVSTVPPNLPTMIPLGSLGHPTPLVPGGMVSGRAGRTHDGRRVRVVFELLIDKQKEEQGETRIPECRKQNEECYCRNIEIDD